MAKKTKRGEGSLSNYFRTLFTNHPEWLEQKSNAVVLDQYRIDHNMPADADVSKSAKEAMANMKSVCRKKLRDGHDVAVSSSGKKAKKAAKAPMAAASRGPNLEALEVKIDECLTLARAFQQDNLANVVRALRYARNKVVYLNGEPD